jgi:hypothetical protein
MEVADPADPSTTSPGPLPDPSARREPLVHAHSPGVVVRRGDGQASSAHALLPGSLGLGIAEIG